MVSQALFMLMHSKGINVAIEVFEVAHSIASDQIVHFLAENYIFVIHCPNIPNLAFSISIMSWK